jgi:hypothetical protein
MKVAEEKQAVPMHLAWRSDHQGKALTWFARELNKRRELDRLLK